MYTPTSDDRSLATRPLLDPGTAEQDRPAHPATCVDRLWPRGRSALGAVLAPITIVGPRRIGRVALDRPLRMRQLLMRTMGITLGISLVWLAACFYEWGTGKRVLPWNPYATCGTSQPEDLPPTVRVGLYEEFPSPGRLAKLRYIDFPVTLAVAAPSRPAFLTLRTMILHHY